MIRHLAVLLAAVLARGVGAGEAVTVPGAWEAQAGGRFADLDGFGWYRCWVRVPEAWRGQRLILTIGATDDVDETWFNGVRVGAHGSPPPFFSAPASSARRPAMIEGDLVRPGGWNLLAIRVYDRGGAGGLTAGPVQLSVGDDALDLAGTWEFRAGDDLSWAQPGNDPALTAEAFLKLAGTNAPARAGLVPVDKAARRRAVEAITRRFDDNANVHAQVDGKGPPLDPAAALAAFRVSDGLVLETVLAEPQVTQPLYLTFDARGRLWVVEYNQYPDPAGLELVTWDEHLRRVFDRVPPPPPYRGEEQRRFVGRDRITIHEDADGDGRFERHKVFLEGGNLVTSVAPAADGVWVLNPPYLLFYPDADGDDKPDGDPVVHLSGFGLEDTHSIANSLKFGPDGWLYGATGSTVTARVRTPLAPERPPTAFLGQAIWRYHPRRHEFELFAEGGWNTFGVDFDDEGNLFSGTNGDLQAVLFVQGGYYQKTFGKHGPHTSPYAFTYLGGIPNDGDRSRLVHQWLVYGGGALPGWEGALLGGNSLAGWVIALRRERQGSSFRTYETGKILTTPDRWFRPVHLDTGPDGAVYLADWYDARITHLDPRDNWDRARGRVYRLKAAGAPAEQPENLLTLPTDALLARLAHPNRWQRWTAVRVLAERRDPAAVAPLRALLAGERTPPALEALWTLHQLDARDAATSERALGHPDPAVRAWAVRLAGDRRASAPPGVFQTFLALAANGASPVVASQLAATAQRLPPEQGWPLVFALTRRDEFAGDPLIPAQLWWAWEAQLTRQPEDAAAALRSNELWDRKLFREAVAGRLARRLAAGRTPAELAVLGQCLRAAPTAESRVALLAGMAEGFEGFAGDGLPAELREPLEAALVWEAARPVLVQAGLRLGLPAADSAAQRMIRDGSVKEADRVALLAALASRPAEGDATWLLALAEADGPAAVRVAAARAWARQATAEELHGLSTKLTMWPPAAREAALLAAAGRADGARALCAAVEAGRLRREAVPVAAVLALRSQPDEATAAAVRRLWGVGRQPDAARMQRAAEVRAAVARGPRDAARGEVLFRERCAACHMLHGTGATVGPDLTGYDRKDVDFLVNAVVDPSLAVREEYLLTTLHLRGPAGGEGAVVAGFVEAGDAARLKLRDLTGAAVEVARADIAREERAELSAMPEGLLDDLDADGLRALFTYLKK
ncbi:MAG: PVC-type heme-binding CxxCH protein [Limisphaerales bacterium]